MQLGEEARGINTLNPTVADKTDSFWYSLCMLPFWNALSVSIAHTASDMVVAALAAAGLTGALVCLCFFPSPKHFAEKRLSLKVGETGM